MNVLVIGGNRFMGLGLVWRLLCRGHRVTVLNRGNLADPFGDRVERIRADRSSDDFDAALAGRTFDRVVDFATYTGADARRAVRVLSGRVGHAIVISTGQVYLVREGCRWPARETDYDGPTLAEAPSPADHEDWAYGIGKRDAEDVLAASPGLPSTRLRIPVVSGVLDPRQRVASLLWRLLDGGPLLVARADQIARHVYSGAVVEAITRALEAPPPAGRVFNLSQTEQPTVRALIELIAERAGARAEIVEVSAHEIEAAGLSVRAAAPFSSAWTSNLDPSRAVAELGFEHPPLATYLDTIVASLFATWSGVPPAGYAHRDRELELVRRR